MRCILYQLFGLQTESGSSIHPALRSSMPSKSHLKTKLHLLSGIKAIEKGIVNLISGDSCLQIDRSKAGKDHSLKEFFHICNPHILDRILRSCFTS